MFDKKVFGARVKHLRALKLLTQYELASLLSVTNTQISDIENGKASTSIERLYILAEYFDVSIDFLVGRSDDYSPYSYQSEWTEDFKRNLAKIIPTLNEADMQDAYFDIDECKGIVDGTAPLNFAIARDISDALGVSLDYLLSRGENSDIND